MTTPLRPNVLIDITSTRERKRKAVKTYESQLRITHYLTYIAALNEVRTLTVPERKPSRHSGWWNFLCVQKKILRDGLHIRHLSQKIHRAVHKIHKRRPCVLQKRVIRLENTGLIFATLNKLDFRKCLTSVMQAYILFTE